MFSFTLTGSVPSTIIGRDTGSNATSSSSTVTCEPLSFPAISNSDEALIEPLSCHEAYNEVQGGRVGGRTAVSLGYCARWRWPGLHDNRLGCK